MLITTTSTLQHREIKDYLGLVSGEAILGANVFRDFFASSRRLSLYQRLSADHLFLVTQR